MKKDNPFLQFVGHIEKTVHIDGLNADIVYRPLTMAEEDGFNLRLLKGSTQEKPQMNMEEANEIKYEKIATMLIEPKITVKELKALNNGASSVIVEILQKLEPKNDATDEEGNSES